MKKNLLRMLGLTAAVALAIFSTAPSAGAASGDCHIQCSSGATYNGPSPSNGCCGLFGSMCGYYGSAYFERGTQVVECKNIGD